MRSEVMMRSTEVSGTASIAPIIPQMIHLGEGEGEGEDGCEGGC